MTKKKLLTNISAGIFALAAPFAMMAALPTDRSITSYAANSEYQQTVSITNGSFNATTSSYLQDDFSGWSRERGNTGANTMVIDIAKNYSSYSSTTYYLKENPGQKGTDGKILMINSATAAPSSQNFSASPKTEGYISNSISLNANSYYEFQVSMKTASFDEATEFGSIYISGLKDENDHDVSLCYKDITARNWETYYFYIATGETSQSITIDLWLGNENIGSTGVVFFDEVAGVRLSENAYYESIQHRDASGNNYKTASFDGREIVDTSALNFDFEQDNSSAVNSLVGWKLENPVSNGHARIIDMNQGNFENITSFTYPGTDFSKNNTKSLVLWADDGYVNVLSQSFDISAFGLYKVTVRAKTADLNGTFAITAREPSDVNLPGISSHSICTATSTAISGDGSDEFINKYNEMVFYIQGYNLYDSKVELLLSLGTSDSHATGAVVVDNIVVEKVDSDDFKTDGNYLELKIGESEEESILNGNFDIAGDVDKKLSYPVAPANWTINQSSANSKKQAGIINIYAPYFTAAGFSFANPGSSLNSTTTDVENIFMMYNSQLDYQSVTSSAFDIAAGSYNDITFRFKTLGEGSSINVKIVDEDGIVLRYDKNISSENWTDYTCTINAGEASNSLKLVVELGSADAKVNGYAFIDRAELATSSEDTFSSAEHKIDLSGFMLSLDPNDSINNAISPSNAFTGAISSGSYDSCEGGIVKGEGNTNFEYIDADGKICPIDDGTLKNNVLVIQTYTASTYTLTSNFKLSTESETNYYKLTFRLLTTFPAAYRANKDAKYGVKIGLDGFDMIEELKSNDGWQEYTILFKSTEAKDANFKFSLVSDELNTAGCAYLTDITWAESDEATYTAASSKDNFEKTLFTSNITADDEAADDEEETDDDTNSNASIDDSMWLLIPSLITAVALIIAIIGFSLRHVKFKKTDKKRKETYDRNTTASEIITNQAKDVQKAEIEKVDGQIDTLKTQIEKLEAQNKDVSAKAREAGKVTAEVEKEFKAFASKRGKLQKQIEELGEHKAMLASPEHLLSIEKKIVAMNKNKIKSSNKNGSKQMKK